MKFIETDKVELKTKVNEQLPKEIEAFLNTNGGVIYIGVADDGTPVGVQNIDETLRKISDIISDQIEPNAIDCVKPEVVYENGLILIKISINKGYGALYCIKKYGFSSNGCHFRIGTTCKSMTLEMIRNAFERSFSDVDMMIKIPSYYGNFKFEKLKLMLLENGFHLDDSSYEANLKLRNLDGRYNLLAELLSDTNHFSFIFAKFKGLTKASYSERSDYGNQCIALAYEKMKERLSLENICKTITNPRPRRDIYLFDMDAVNEALINAVVHNDYRITEPQVSFFDDRLEILSHGGLPIGLSKEDFFAGVSRPRNEHLMDIFKRLGIAEHTGHGVPTILAKYGKKAFNISEGFINIVIPFNKEVLENHGPINASISAVWGEETNVSVEPLGAAKNEKGVSQKKKAMKQAVLEILRKDPTITAKGIAIKLSVSPRTAQRQLSSLKDSGIIERVGSDKKGRWKVL